MKNTLIFIMIQIISVPLLMKSLLASQLTVNLKLHTLTYEDKSLNIYKSFPVVGPDPKNLHHYNNGRIFDIDALAYKPDWIDAQGKIFHYGNSPLGVGIIRFKDINEGKGRSCGIHGNAQEQDLGKNLSGCCIRMRDNDFLEIFYDIEYDTFIEIKY